jgi:hypothetical protein
LETAGASGLRLRANEQCQLSRVRPSQTRGVPFPGLQIRVETDFALGPRFVSCALIVGLLFDPPLEMAMFHKRRFGTCARPQQAKHVRPTVIRYSRMFAC